MGIEKFEISSFRIFYQRRLSDYFEVRRRSLHQKVLGESTNYILDVNEEQYVTHLISQFEIDELVLHFDQMEAIPYEALIPVEYLERVLFDTDTKHYRGDVVRFRIPFEGDQELLECQPSTSLLWSCPVRVGATEISFDIIVRGGSIDYVNQECQTTLNGIRQQFSYLKKEVTDFNNGLGSDARSAFRRRKDELLKKNDLFSKLNVPVRKRSETPSTFTIPPPALRKKIVVTRPSVLEASSGLEPKLDDVVYTQILQMIHDVGKQFERLPSTYAEKDEETLRDHILLFLEPNFEGTATGETFNKTGKTDILLRHEGKNVFIAECKFWRGEKAYLETISQLLGYLTWRDSKAAVVVFVPNKGFTEVLEKVKVTTPQHPNFKAFVSAKDETWLNYRFCLDDDERREIKMAVLLFHLPR